MTHDRGMSTRPLKRKHLPGTLYEVIYGRHRGLSTRPLSFRRLDKEICRHDLETSAPRSTLKSPTSQDTGGHTKTTQHEKSILHLPFHGRYVYILWQHTCWWSTFLQKSQTTTCATVAEKCCCLNPKPLLVYRKQTPKT